MSKELALVNSDNDLVVLDDDEIHAGSGLKNVDETDRMVPRLQIAAGTSKQIMKGTEKFIPGLSVGELFNTVTKEVYGDSVQVVPVWFSKNRILFDKEWKIECSSPDGISGGSISPKCIDCEFQLWGSGPFDKGFACTELRNFAVLVVEKDGGSSLASVSFKTTSSGVAKSWLNMIEARKAKTAKGLTVQLPMYKGLYTLSPASKENKEKGVTFYIWSVNNAGSIDTRTDEGKTLAAKAKAAYISFEKMEKTLIGQGDAE